jgi:uncharacterized protein YceK
MKPIACLLAAALPFMSGCAAVSARREDGAGEMYAGVREDVAQLRDTENEDERPLERFFHVIDMPFSFLLDTLLIPYDWLSRKKTE